MGNRFSEKIEQINDGVEFSEEHVQFDGTENDTYSKLFMDDCIECDGVDNETMVVDSDAPTIFESLFADDYDMEGVDVDGNGNVKEDEKKGDIDLTDTYAPNSVFSKGGNTYETDDNGKVFKVNGEQLLPNTEYEIDGNKYETDSNGRIIAVEAYPKSTPEGERDTKAQEQAGGEDRREHDQGGHILARILGGSKGIENIVAMWEKVNTGPYKKMENEVVNAVKTGKDVKMNVSIEYEGDSERPSKITVKYTIDGKETIVVFGNDEGSTELKSELADVADEEAYKDIQDEIDDAEADGEEVSVLSVKVEYDENGSLENVVVCIRYGGENHYRNVSPKQEG